MPLRTFSGLFKRSRTDSTASDNSAQSQIPPTVSSDRYQRIDSISSWISYDPKDYHVEDTAPHKFMTCLPHTLVTSDLGAWGRAFRLRFSHFLQEDPAIAVFSQTQDTPVPYSWRCKRAWCPNVFRFRCRVRKGVVKMRSPCIVRVIVGSRWQYKISPKSIRYWSLEAGIILVDWSDMYDDYFAKDGKRKNKQRAHAIVKKFRKLETKALINETGAHWTGYGDWNIDAPTAADVALACRFEGQGFEDGLVPLKKKMTARELKSRIRQVTDALNGVVSRHIARGKWKVRVKLRRWKIVRGEKSRRTSRASSRGKSKSVA
ncbi:hypothetical protein CC86DRAFT_409806 [Ophiobolus disseminans]|uniref:Uncharacterized protein n=1 Tax=Ophiobolus disseminans TaxID=1469910 RepID=A0A6A6ZRG1_9PLEO|nr:hypothetical protein CC86DRAFT_409806 [Ophiobolus disseminans]